MPGDGVVDRVVISAILNRGRMVSNMLLREWRMGMVPTWIFLRLNQRIVLHVGRIRGMSGQMVLFAIWINWMSPEEISNDGWNKIE